ncbi:MAG: NAD(P)-dependent glycerol-3-phosphate dehydrogenase [Alphaproteobacteria bacterium]|nr:NAD(P)-dependent glycerol-3-phosphate dehydrogenase [Alphaproteobacteria bacterium]
MKHISVIGAGAWGTALALAAYRAGFQVTIWSISFEEVETINQRHENVYRLPGVALDPSIRGTTDLQEAAKTDLIILAPPAQFMRSTCEKLCAGLPSHTPLIIASKGIENGTCLLMSEVIRKYCPLNPLLVLSGPSFANDVAKKLPTAVTLAAEDLELSCKMANLLSSPFFRLYASDDIIGTQLGGACKNIIAMACGIVEGLEFGDNARAAVVARGLAEIARLGRAMGAQSETFLGLSGVGDITLTSLSSQSRNQSFGYALGRGTPLDELLANKKTLTEGLYTIPGAAKLAEKHHVDMPITFAMNNLLHRNGTLETLIEHLLNRPLKKDAA